MMPLPTTTSPHRGVFVIILAVCGTLNAVTLVWLLLRHPFINADFLGFWAYPRFSPVREIYDPGAMMRFQQALYPGYRSFFPFTYPPDFLAVTSWLRHLSFNAARDVWTLAGLAALATAGRALLPGWGSVIALLASPAALLTLVQGQTAFFATALLLAGLALLPSWPVLAGIAFGLLTLKPQMGLLLPLLLLARGEWSAILTAILTAGALVAASCAVLPPDLWRLWMTSLPHIQGDYFGGGANLNIMITPAANLLHLGAGLSMAMGAQALCSLAVAAAVFLMARRAPYKLAVAAMLAGTFLAQPHAYAYDTVALPAAMALCLTARPPAWLVALGALAYVAPLALLSPAAPWFLYSPLLAGLFGGIIVLAYGARQGAISSHAPDLPSPTL